MAQVTLTRPVVDAAGHEAIFTTTLTINTAPSLTLPATLPATFGGQ
ncbi:hypothetical protein [Nocardioides speluncae]|nr:hypothetical protein [Nocardioides speluncae]